MASADSVYRRTQILKNHLCSRLKDYVPAHLEAHVTCGIIAYVGSKPATPFLLEGLKILQNRGYDSAGITTITPDSKLSTTKFASRETTSDALIRLETEAHVHGSNSVGIGHTRWATHGGKTDTNAHPHHDSRNRIAVIHNGVIENSDALKKRLQEEKNVEFRSETDTEVIAQMIGQFVHEGDSVLDAVQKTLGQLEGTWGLAILDCQQPNQIITAANGSPILIGVGNGQMFIASEAAAFSRHTKSFIALNDGEVAVITAEGHSLDRQRIEQAPDEEMRSSPAPYPDWTIKEILEQPHAVSRALNYGGRIKNEAGVMLGGLESRRDLLLEIDHLIITGCGTSYFAGSLGAQLMRFLDAFETVQVVDAAEMDFDYLPTQHAGMLVLSQSGETKDVQRALALAQEHNVPTFSVVNVVRSLIARTTGCGVYLNAGRENAVASTKAFTCQVTVLSLIAVWFTQYKHTEKKYERKRTDVVQALHRLPTNMGMSLHQLREPCKSIAQSFCNSQHCFILGKGFAEPVAREGALKIKELTYVHAEGFSGGALKHGPFALISKGTPIILLILRDRHRPLMNTACAEVKARGAYTIVITDAKENLREADVTLHIPHNGPLTALLCVLPLQLIAYELAILRGHDPDKPRNLAKAVTTD